jgi:hypothetical protein
MTLTYFSCLHVVCCWQDHTVGNCVYEISPPPPDQLSLNHLQVDICVQKCRYTRSNVFVAVWGMAWDLIWLASEHESGAFHLLSTRFFQNLCIWSKQLPPFKFTLRSGGRTEGPVEISQLASDGDMAAVFGVHEAAADSWSEREFLSKTYLCFIK